MSYAGMGLAVPRDVLQALASKTGVSTGVSTTGSPASATGGVSPAERDEIANAMLAAATLRTPASRRAVRGQGRVVDAAADVRALRGGAALLRRLQPGATGAIPNSPVLILVQATLASRPGGGGVVPVESLINAQFRPGRPPLAARLAAMSVAPFQIRLSPVIVTRQLEVAKSVQVTASDKLAADKVIADAATNPVTKLAADKVVVAQSDADAMAKAAVEQATKADAATSVAAQSTGATAQVATEMADAAQAEAARLAEAAAAAAAAADLARVELETAASVTNDTSVTVAVATTGLGPLGVSWKVWGLGAAVLVGGYLFMNSRAVSKNRRRVRRNTRHLVSQANADGDEIRRRGLVQHRDHFSSIRAAEDYVREWQEQGVMGKDYLIIVRNDGKAVLWYSKGPGWESR